MGRPLEFRIAERVERLVQRGELLGLTVSVKLLDILEYRRFDE